MWNSEFAFNKPFLFLSCFCVGFSARIISDFNAEYLYFCTFELIWRTNKCKFMITHSMFSYGFAVPCLTWGAQIFSFPSLNLLIFSVNTLNQNLIVWQVYLFGCVANFSFISYFRFLDWWSLLGFLFSRLNKFKK